MVESRIIQFLRPVDYFIIAGVVAVVEFIKVKIMKEDPKYKNFYKFAPLILAALTGLVIALVTKDLWYVGLRQGLLDGVVASGFYASILSVIIKVFSGAKTDLVEGIKEEISKVNEK